MFSSSQSLIVGFFICVPSSDKGKGQTRPRTNWMNKNKKEKSKNQYTRKNIYILSNSGWFNFLSLSHLTALSAKPGMKTCFQCLNMFSKHCSHKLTPIQRKSQLLHLDLKTRMKFFSYFFAAEPLSPAAFNSLHTSVFIHLEKRNFSKSSPSGWCQQRWARRRWRWRSAEPAWPRNLAWEIGQVQLYHTMDKSIVCR